MHFHFGAHKVSKTSAGSFTSCFFIFLFHFRMALGFLITSNLPDLISFSSLCLFLCFAFSLFYFLFCTFDSLNYFMCCLTASFSFFNFIFSSQVRVDPLFLQLRLGTLLAPTFQDLLLLFMPIVNFSSVSFCYPG